jgi:hypothetical protein
MKNMVYECKVDTRELLQQIVDAARNVKNATALCTVRHSLEARVRICIQADDSHFEQLLITHAVHCAVKS